MQLGSEIVPSFPQYRPVVLIVCSAKNHGPYLDARKIVGRRVLRTLAQNLAPVATDTVDSANLLLDSPGARFRRDPLPSCVTDWM